MPNFDDGQKAIIKVLIQDELNAREGRKVAWYKRGTFQGTACVAIFFLAAFLSDRFYGRLWLSQLVHSMIGTDLIVAEDLGDEDKATNKTIERIIAAKISSNTPNISKDLEQAVADGISDGNNQINKNIAKVISDVVSVGSGHSEIFSNGVYDLFGDKPILMFQGSYNFGVTRTVTVSNQLCTERIREKYVNNRSAIEENNKKFCLYSGEVPEGVDYEIPFYANFFHRDGEPWHNAYLAFALTEKPAVALQVDAPRPPLLPPLVTSATANEAPDFGEADPDTPVEPLLEVNPAEEGEQSVIPGLTIELQSEIGESVPLVTKLSIRIKKYKDNIYWVDIGDAYRKDHPEENSVPAKGAYLQSVKFHASQDYLTNNRKTLAVQSIIVLNRKLSQIWP